jgi:serine/threonine protein kinase
MLDNHILNPLFLSRYVLSSSLGAGGYGFVVVALDLRNPLHPSYAHSPQPSRHTHREVAVKFILREKVPSYAWVSYSGGGEMGDGMPKVGERVPMECEVLRRVNHWGVVRGEGLYADPKFFYLVRVLFLSSSRVRTTASDFR